MQGWLCKNAQQTNSVCKSNDDQKRPSAYKWDGRVECKDTGSFEMRKELINICKSVTSGTSWKIYGTLRKSESVHAGWCARGVVVEVVGRCESEAATT